jgi:hypothetical protein
MQCHSTFDDDRAAALLEALGLAAEADDVQLFMATGVNLATGPGVELVTRSHPYVADSHGCLD